MVKAKIKTEEVAPDSSPKKKSKTILIICEKPQASMKIASALSDGKDEQHTDKGVSFYEFTKNGQKIFVGCAVGHLFGLGQKEKGAKTPNFDIEWKPNYESKGAEYTKKYYDVLKKLSKQANEFVVATDYDVEGEVIGLNVVRYICGQKDAKRMKFSSLTKEELQQSFENLSPTLNWGQAIAGETRHYLDWFYGINLSRALMKSISKTGSFRILSIGRVQGPTLGIIVDKELQIQKFKSEPYWQVFLQIKDKINQKIEVMFPKDLKQEKELLQFKQLKGKKAIASTEIKDEKILPPIPFDLTTLQTEAYRLHGLTPTQTLQIAQGLYLEGLISYPRTSSQKYPEAIGFEKILKQLTKHFSAVKYAKNKIPTEGKKSDPAHPAIYPTGEFRKLEGQNKELYDLIVRRFISCFCDSALVENKRITAEINSLKFFAKGMQIKEKNWLSVYDFDMKEAKIPTINGEVDITEIRIEEKQTQPPKRFSPASIVKELEKRNLGTKSTRASIIETLYSRGYVKERSLEATSLGIRLIGTLKKYSPVIIDEQLTRDIEKEMDSIITSKKDLDKKQAKIIDTAKKSITEIIDDMTKNIDKIGKELAEANTELREKERQDNTLNQCPKCKKGNFRILFNRGSKRYFVACSAYPECKNTFSLPPNALIKPAKENCPDCGFAMLLAIRKAKRPWKFCFNPECPQNKARAEEYQKKKEDESKEEKKEVENKGTA
ncbi:MAG: DNA topoisomerase I [Nanoarchaeota archaeon]|nr:DNA topoisomerase I [Nanoarchaeota archaeon]